MFFFYFWLGITMVVSYFLKTEWADALWYHSFYTFIFLLIHRVFGVAYFIYLINREKSEGLSTEILEGATLTQVFQEEGEIECSICFANYDIGDVLRVLRCKHRFHKLCVDPWLRQERNVCPLCLTIVAEDDKED